MLKTNSLIWVMVLMTLALNTQANNEGFSAKEKPESGPTSILVTPLRTGGNNLFHSLILIPPLETAARIEQGKRYLQMGTEYAAGNYRKERKGWLLDYDAQLMKSYVDLCYGVSEALEVKAGLTSGVLTGDKSDRMLFKGQTGYLTGTRHLGLSDLLLGVKHRFRESLGDEEDYPYTSALGIWLKKPLAQKENLLSSGGTDLAIAHLETDELDQDLYLHTQIGYTFTGKENVFREDLKIDNTLFYGMGISYQRFKELALIGQIQGNLNAFKEIKSLTQHPLTVTGGFRYQGLRYFTEAGLGLGLNNASADFTLLWGLGTLF